MQANFALRFASLNRLFFALRQTKKKKKTKKLLGNDKTRQKRAQSFRFADGGSPALFVAKRRKIFKAWQVFLRGFPIQKDELGKENKTEKDAKQRKKSEVLLCRWLSVDKESKECDSASYWPLTLQKERSFVFLMAYR